MTTALQFENVSKVFRGARTYRALREDIVAGVGRVVGIGRGPRQAVVALEDLSFQVEQGESFGVIGPNGAGKTTLLKLACRISYPTAGTIRVRGRIGALLEVGTGMHPELTGRENIDLYGRILGLSGTQIAGRQEQIIEFAGVADAIDRPVKQYSSGMILRLGFSIAAHLEPDIMVVDEAIAVGDAAFQARCVDRMAALVREGRTLIFVSHDLTAMETLCRRALVLDHGGIAYEGPAAEAVRQYLLDVHANRMRLDPNAIVARSPVTIETVTLLNKQGEETMDFRSGEAITVRLHYNASHPVEGPVFSLMIRDARVGALSQATMLQTGDLPQRLSGRGYVDCTFAALPLRPRTYEIWGSLRRAAASEEVIPHQRLRLFRVLEAGPAGDGTAARNSAFERAPVAIPYSWSFGGVAEPDRP